jgi:hypothetical protein
MTDRRSSAAQEAKRLRDLGRFPEAETHYLAAENIQTDLKLGAELAAMYLEQGCVSKSLEKINKAMAESMVDGERASGVDPSVFAMAQMVQLSSEAASKGNFSTTLERAAVLYQNSITRFAADVIDECQVSILDFCLLATY